MAAVMSIVRCPRCGAKNRLDERALRMQPKCGKCGARLDPDATAGADDVGGKPIEVTDATLETLLAQARQPIRERTRARHTLVMIERDPHRQFLAMTGCDEQRSRADDTSRVVSEPTSQIDSRTAIRSASWASESA